MAGDILGNERLERTEQCAFFRFYGILPALRDRADDRKRLLHHFGSRIIGVLRLCLCGRLTAEQVGHGFHRVLQCLRVVQQRGKHIVFHAKASLFAENVPQLSGKPRTLGCLHEFCAACAALRMSPL